MAPPPCAPGVGGWRCRVPHGPQACSARRSRGPVRGKARRGGGGAGRCAAGRACPAGGRRAKCRGGIPCRGRRRGLYVGDTRGGGVLEAQGGRYLFRGTQFTVHAFIFGNDCCVLIILWSWAEQGCWLAGPKGSPCFKNNTAPPHL